MLINYKTCRIPYIFRFLLYRVPAWLLLCAFQWWQCSFLRWRIVLLEFVYCFLDSCYFSLESSHHYYSSLISLSIFEKKINTCTQCFKTCFQSYTGDLIETLISSCESDHFSIHQHYHYNLGAPRNPVLCYV
jgi:hypothetical protein